MFEECVLIPRKRPESGRARTNFTGGTNRQADQAVVEARVDWMLDNGFKEPFVVLGNNENGNEPFETAMNHAYNNLTSLGHAVQLQTITPRDNIATMISGFKAQIPPVKSIYVCSDPYLTVNSRLLNDEAHTTTPPGTPYINTMFEFKEHMIKLSGFKKAAHYAHEIISHTATASKLPIYIASLSGGGAAGPTSKTRRRKKSPMKKKK